MNAPRHIRVIAALTEAQGRWVNSEQLAAFMGCGKPQVAAAISEARAQGGVAIETHKFRGAGWRIPPRAAAHGAAPAAAPASRPAEPLSSRAQTMADRLRAAGGQFVDGLTLAEAIAADITQLSTYAAELRRKQPELLVEGKRGRGYRLGCLAEQAGLPPARPPLEQHSAHRAAIDLLKTLHPQAAETVRDIALQSGQGCGDVIERLIYYGAEVHRDLVVHGQHPHQMRRLAGKAA